MKFFNLLLLIILQSCVVNQGNFYQSFELKVERELRCDDSNLIDFDPNLININNNLCQLKSNYITFGSLDLPLNLNWFTTDLSSNNNQASFNLNDQKIDFNCQGLPTSLTYDEVFNDYQLYHETHLISGDSLATPIRIVDNDNYYLIVTDGQEHSFYLANAGILFNLHSVNHSLDLSANKHFKTKIRVVADQIDYKVWEASELEPNNWQLQVNNATHANGKPGLACLTAQGHWHNLRQYDVNSLTDYSLNAASFSLQNLTFEKTIKLEAIILNAITPNQTAIRFDLSLDNGNTFMSFINGEWQENTQDFDQALTLDQFNQELKKLTLNLTQLKLRIHLKSLDGNTTPKIQSLKLKYTEAY